MRSLGSEGSGLVAIRNVPGFVEAKRAFLPMAHDLVTLPSEYLENKLTDAESLYNAGWSHGKEKMGDKPDLAKGSFYYNPVTDLPGSPQDRKKYPVSYPINKWPKDELPEFEEAARRIGNILKSAVIALTGHVDRLAASKVASYPSSFLSDNMKGTEKVKCRLLYYFPLPESSGENQGTPSEDSWIGWHNDSGFFTALAGDMYVNHETGEQIECPDPNAGLYVVHRNGQVQKVTIPEDCLAIQMGECLQIVTGGTVTATPHCVRGAAATNVARISLPCFVDTPPDFPLEPPPKTSRGKVLESSNSCKVPALALRWDEGQTFGDFLQKTFATYYEWSTK